MKPIVIKVTDTHKIIDNLRLSSRSRDDPINYKLLKNIKLASSFLLCDIFDQPLFNSIISTDRKRRRSVPIFKLGNRNSPTNCKISPISVAYAAKPLNMYIDQCISLAPIRINYFPSTSTDAASRFHKKLVCFTLTPNATADKFRIPRFFKSLQQTTLFLPNS